jgi:anti-sigma factor RsiW
MTAGEGTEEVPTTPTEAADERRRARLAQIEADQEHGRQLIERYGRGSVSAAFRRGRARAQ